MDGPNWNANIIDPAWRPGKRSRRKQWMLEGRGGEDPENSIYLLFKYIIRTVPNIRKRYRKSYEKMMGYKGRLLPWDKLMPAEKTDLLNKEGWDLTPQAFVEYFTLSKKYEKSKKDYPIEKTIWEIDEVIERLIRSIS